MNASNPLIRYATRGETRIDFNKLTLPEKIKFVLYQMIYKSYLELARCTTTIALGEYASAVDQMIMKLPPNPNLHGTDLDIYKATYNVIRNFNNRAINWKHLDEVLSFPNDPKSGLDQMAPSRDFYLPLFAALGFGYPMDVYPDGKKPGADIYVPSISKWFHDNSKENHLFISFNEIHTLDYDFNLVSKISGGSQWTSDQHITVSLLSYLSHFNLMEFTIDDVIGILSNFSLEHGKYATRTMMNDSYNLLYSACYDVITNSNTLRGKRVSSNIVVECCKALGILKDYHRIGNLEDTQVFSLLISKFDMPDNASIAGYLTKPVDEVTANEALAFRNSPIKLCINDKLLNLSAYKISNEAASEDPDDIPLDDNAEPAEGDDTLPDGEEPLLPDDSGLNQVDDSPPPRDPTKLLIELAKSDETFADYLYRKLVSARIRDLLNNPPKNIPPKEVLLLRKWLTHWINLVSINTVKDFLSRLSFRLNDLELDSDNI